MSMDTLSTYVHGGNGYTLLGVVGEIDLFTLPLFEQAVLLALGKNAPDLVVDLRQVGYMSVQGARCLFQAAEELGGHGGELRLVVMDTGIVVRLFEVVGVPASVRLRRCCRESCADCPGVPDAEEAQASFQFDDADLCSFASNQLMGGALPQRMLPRTVRCR